MSLVMTTSGAHPEPREEVMAMDDVDVNVGCESVNNTSDLRERMGDR